MTAKLINHESESYKKLYNQLKPEDRYNGAYYYSVEICKNIIPGVRTKRPFVTINTGEAFDNAVVFIHNNLRPQIYEYLKNYRNLILVCGLPSTVKKMSRFGRAIYLPLSVDLLELEKYKTDKTKEVAFAGRPSKKDEMRLPDDIDFLENLPRDEFLKRLAMYKKIYAVGRTALEAKALGCEEILPYDKRFPDPSVWHVLDNRIAAEILQARIDEIDGKF